MLVSVWLQGLFTTLFRLLFTFPSQYLFTIGHSRVFSLTGWCRQIQTGLLQPRSTQDTATYLSIHLQDYHLLRSGFPTLFYSSLICSLLSFNPNHAETSLVWASPRSLATTGGITFVFFSYSYLDVSVQSVRAKRQITYLTGCPIRRS